MTERDYQGFVEEYEERVEKGLPIDRTTMLEMAEKYNTLLMKDCDEVCALFRQNTCSDAGRFWHCTRLFKPTTFLDDAGPVIFTTEVPKNG